MIVPWGHGYKSVKFLQNIRLTNDYRANDTYAQIAEGDEGNDPGSVQKTYTTVDLMLNSSPIKHANVRLTGVLMNGRTPASHLEYCVRKVNSKLGSSLAPNDPQLMNAPWKRFEIPAPPALIQTALPKGIKAKDVFGIDEDGVPKIWPLPFSYCSWSVTIGNLSPGFYEIRARAVDVNGNKQPQPRPYRKNGRNSVMVRRVHIL